MKPFDKIIVSTVPQSAIRFSTAGDWKLEDDGTLNVWLCNECPDWRYWACMLMHELTEILICRHRRVSSKEADDFDALWEKELAQGMHDKKLEAGFDKKCPYREGHIWGARMERLFCFLLGLRWKTYCNFWDGYFEKLEPKV